MWRLLRIATIVTLLGLAAGAAVLLFLVYTCPYPPDHVCFVITNVPDDARFLCLLSDSQGRMRPMQWYVGEMLQKPAKVAPKPYSFDYGRNEHASAGFVAWEIGDRYGVAVKSASGTWQVFWLPAAQVPLEGRSVIFGGGTIRIDLSKVVAQPLSDDAANALGLQQISEPHK
ncbi:MAG TPA: hypothetical protein DDY78_19050 [Planctomycetales bacterium]|jgi:hypothetical protein|nr:hypothetical protein [Planctomycetales bacterium]